MSDGVEVSIFCITYNHEKYIRKALDGFVMQKTDFCFEVIVHDDASTDNTPNIIKEYEEKYPHIIKPIYEKENQYSKGIKLNGIMLPKARGNYIAYCEGDDFWIDDCKLQKQYDVIKQNPIISIVVGKVICCEEDGSPSKAVFPDKKFNLVKSGLIKSEIIANAVLKSYPFHTSSFFVSKQLVMNMDKRDFYHSRCINGDESLLREALIEGDFYYIDEPISCRRMDSINGWNQRFKRQPGWKKVDHFLKRAYGQMLFDKESNGRFHDLVYLYQTSALCSYGCGDKEMFKVIRDYYSIKPSIILKMYGVKSYVKFIMTPIFPHFIKWITGKRFEKNSN